MHFHRKSYRVFPRATACVHILHSHRSSYQVIPHATASVRLLHYHHNCQTCNILCSNYYCLVHRQICSSIVCLIKYVSTESYFRCCVWDQFKTFARIFESPIHPPSGRYTLGPNNWYQSRYSLSLFINGLTTLEF